MKLFKYGQFKDQNVINEDLNKAKKFLKERFLLNKAATDLGLVKGELKAQLDHKEKRSLTLRDFSPEEQEEIKGKLRELRLTDDQVRTIERDPEFIKIREKLGQKYIGWTYPFTYFYFVEMVSMDELFDNPDSIFNKLINYTGLLDKLPKRFDHNFIDPNIPNNSEVLVDGLDTLEDYRKIKRVVDQLTPTQKRDYQESPEVIKGQFAEVARAFHELGGGDKEKHERLWKGFFGEVKTIEEDTVIQGKAYKKGDKRYFGQLYRYQNIREFIKAAQNYLKSSDNDSIIAFYEKINNCNEKYGTLGADIVFDENGILIIEVKSFVANQFLNGHTRHCIKDYASQWDNYVANHDNKQYYIYNFNIPQYDDNSTIGVTIAPGQSIRAAHNKPDHGVSGSIKTILKGWEKSYDIKTDLFFQLKPMTNEEIEKRRRAKVAEREIIRKGLSIEQITKYVKEDGANINKDNCVALLNAVEEDDLEKVKVILELGGNPNLRSKADAIINKAQTLDMIKLLVANGSELTGEVFNNISNDVSAVEYCLKQGLNPNFDNGLPLRRSARGSWKSVNDIGEGYFEVFKLLIKHGANFDDARHHPLKSAAEHKRLNFIDYMINELGLRVGFKSAYSWVNHARKLGEEDKKEVLAYLKDKADKYES